MINVRAMVALKGSAGSDTCKVRQALKKTSRNISTTPESKLSCSESSAISSEAIVGRACSNGIPTPYATQPPVTVKARPLSEGCLVKTDHSSRQFACYYFTVH
jgi:hypothetical protein